MIREYHLPRLKMTTLELLAIISKAFVTDTREDRTKYTKLNESIDSEVLDYLEKFVTALHDDGNKLPNDFRYRTIETVIDTVMADLELTDQNTIDPQLISQLSLDIGLTYDHEYYDCLFALDINLSEPINGSFYEWISGYYSEYCMEIAVSFLRLVISIVDEPKDDEI